MEDKTLKIFVCDNVRVHDEVIMAVKEYPEEEKLIPSPFGIFVIPSPTLSWTPNMARAPSFGIKVEANATALPFG